MLAPSNVCKIKISLENIYNKISCELSSIKRLDLIDELSSIIKSIINSNDYKIYSGIEIKLETIKENIDAYNSMFKFNQRIKDFEYCNILRMNICNDVIIELREIYKRIS